jgi:hypothetical protein
MYLNDLRIFDIPSKTWLPEVEPEGEKPLNRCAHAAALIPSQNAMVIFGGFIDHVTGTDQMAKYFIENNTWVIINQYV